MLYLLENSQGLGSLRSKKEANGSREKTASCLCSLASSSLTLRVQSVRLASLGNLSNHSFLPLGLFNLYDNQEKKTWKALT